MKKIDYKNLIEVIVKCQEDYDNIPSDYNGTVYFENGQNTIIVRENKGCRRVAWENSSVEARGNSSVEARENSSVVARENSSVEAWGNSSVVAWKNSSVVARENSSVVAWENSSVVAWENSSVVARGNSSVVARENSSVEALGNSSVVAWENSSVVARGNSSVEARGNSSVVALGNSSVEARENSSVEASGNSQTTDRSKSHKIKTTANARIVYMPKEFKEFIDFFGVKRKGKTKVVMYKAVHKVDGKYTADYIRSYEYEIGKKYIQNCNSNVAETCSYGLNIAHLSWCVAYGYSWNDLAILEVETKISDVVMPTDTDGKVRTSELKVLREVPLSECGVMGKSIERRINNAKDNQR